MRKSKNSAVKNKFYFNVKFVKDRYKAEEHGGRCNRRVWKCRENLINVKGNEKIIMGLLCMYYMRFQKLGSYGVR